MARIPQYDGRQVETAALPNARQQIATPDGAFGMTQARQLGQVAQVAGQTAKVFMEAKNEADQTRVDDALNQLRESEIDLTYNKDTGYTNLRGVQALERPDKRPLSDEYFDKLNTRRGEIETGLGNDQQREAFRRRANDRLTAFKGGLMNYEGDQFRSYQLSVAEGTVGTATKQLALYYNDPEKIADGVLSIQSAVAKAGRLQGLSAEQITVNTEKMVSNAHLGAIEQALATSNPLQAEQYLRTYKEQITPTDMLKARSKVDEMAADVIGTAKADQAVGGYVAKTNPNDFDRLVDITMQTESAGRRYGPDGKTLLTSPKGAKGEMQVMDGTKTDPGFGVRPARDNSPEELARVGRDYLGAMLKRYDANPALAWAAYNAGPGALDKALAEAKKEGNLAGWLNKLPSETQQYVAKNIKAFGEGGGRPKAPTYDEAKAALAADPDLQSRPLAYKKALEQFDRKWSDHQKGVKINQDNAFADAMRHIEGGGAYDSIPDSLKRNLDPAKWDDLRKYENTVRGEGATTDLAVYQQLATNPARVKAMTDSEFYALRRDLSATDFKKFADMRAPGKDGKDSSGALDMEAINQTLNQRYTGMGLNLKNEADKMRAGAITRHIQDVVLAEQRKQDRQLTDEQVLKVVDQQFLRTRAFKVGGWFNSDGVRKEQLLGMKMRDIPASTLKSLKADFAAQGIKEPSDQQVLQAYFEMDRSNPNSR